jgi:hypothetical protein
MSTSGSIHGEFLRLLFFLSNKQADDYFAALGYEAHKEEFCHRLCVFFYRNRQAGLWKEQQTVLLTVCDRGPQTCDDASLPRL